MSFLLSSRNDEDDEDKHPHQAAAAAPLDLLDEYWFFSNTLNVKQKKMAPLPPSKSPSTSSTTATSTSSRPRQQRQGLAGGRRLLLRTPSLPPPRIPSPNNKEDEEQAEAEVDDDDLNWSSIYEGVLRTRVASSHENSSISSNRSSLQRAPSMPVVSSSDDARSSKDKEPSMPSNKLIRHSHSTLQERPSSSKQQTPRSSGSSSKKQQQPGKKVMVRSKSTVFQPEAADKKWKSSSDLESIEVQGFKDLGFVFDKEELREDLADVLPGLNKQNNATGRSGHGAVRRPYLSEAWHNSHRPPALIRVQSEARSASEMKNQLRMWAQAVACNARQECA